MTEKTETQKPRRRRLEKNQELEIVGESAPKKAKVKLPERKIPQMSFDAWWMRTQKKHGFSKEMKEIVQKHFAARGFMKSKRFDEGLKDFGL